MDSKTVREKYIKFFVGKNHVDISPAPLVLDDDPTTLFTSSGMQPLVPYLAGQEHPKGTRLVDSQPSIRTQDIEEVGDNRHTTFFEMLGNWSLGDYFKDEQLAWVYEFLTKEVGLSRQKLWVSVFEGDKQVPKDTESVEIWKKLGMPESRIRFYDAKKNWWSRNGTPDQMPIGDIGGPDSEVFYDFGKDLGLHEKSIFRKEKCHINCDCGRFLEIGNSVFIQYKKVGERKLEELPQKNVDFGGGLERIVAAAADDPDVFKTDLFSSHTEIIEGLTGKSYKDNEKEMRIICDHTRASVMLVANGVTPSNKMQGYVLRRLIRRSTIKAKRLDSQSPDKLFSRLVEEVFRCFDGLYLREEKRESVTNVILDEINKFERTLEKGLKEVEKIQEIDGRKAFDLYQTYGFPLEITAELFEQKGQSVDINHFQKEFEEHKNRSRSAGKGVFKGGLSGHSQGVKRLHTATHLLQSALRQVLGDHVGQKGQNITNERSRFDFSHSSKLSDKEFKKVENLINQKITDDLPVKNVMLPRGEAEKSGALHFFGEKYSDEVSIYFIGEDLKSAFSKEFCGGPHVSRTSEIGRVKIIKQEKIGSGVLRLYVSIE